jgi:phage shock protein A
MLGKDVDREVAALRARINEALAYEDQLKAQAATARAEADSLDQQADDAVARGDDVTARYLIERQQRATQRLTILENDLRQHQFVTQELITRVNMLDAAIADARNARPNVPAANETESATPVRQIADVLRDAREKIASMGDVLAAKDEVAQSGQTPPSPSEAVEDDLAKRRARLSK